jgi:hypothetical protein
MSEQETGKQTIPKGQLENFARGAYTEEKTAREQRDREAEQKQGQIAVEKLKALGVNENEITLTTPYHKYAIVGSLKFTSRHSYASRFGSYDTLHLVQACKHCGKDILSSQIGSLSDLGRVLEQFTEDYNTHACVSELPVPKSTEERLLDVLREFVTEQIAESAELAEP